MTETTLANPGLAGITGDVRDEFRRRHGDSWPDRALIAAAGSVLSIPKVAPASSFVLHAPLELLARAGLLTSVEPASRQAARERIAWLVATYEAAGDPVEPPGPVSVDSVASTTAGGSLDEVAAQLVAALAAGDLDAVDRFATLLGANATPLDLRRLLAGALVPSLAAAGHSSILLYLFPRIASAHAVRSDLVRGPARELARHPDWRLHWFDHSEDVPPTTDRSLVDALLSVPVLGSPGSDFIYPVMNQAEASGIAADLLSGPIAGPIDVTAARQSITRVAAWSMLQESSNHAPYGWTHCLTMAQAVMGLAGDGVAPRTALAAAGTYVTGFRAALGERSLDPEWRPEAPETTDLVEALAAGPQAAAATTWHAPDSQLGAIVTELATHAALHHDAHLVKYTLACFDAAADDPSHRRLYLAAAASLAAWWRAQPTDGFFA
jgi:hypothetical protein